MGVEIFQYALKEDCPALQGVLAGSINGQILQNIGHLYSEIREGESGDEYLDDFRDHATPEEVEAMNSVYKMVQRSPHFLAICFDGASRGHDHWSYLLDLGADFQQSENANATIFGSEIASESANASQGAPIKWSNVERVSTLNQFLKTTDNEEIASKFDGFPANRDFYKRRKDEALQGCLYELAGVRRLYDLAFQHQLAIVTVLD